jgi:hypothetical protein
LNKRQKKISLRYHRKKLLHLYQGKIQAQMMKRKKFLKNQFQKRLTNLLLKQLKKWRWLNLFNHQQSAGQNQRN